MTATLMIGGVAEMAEKLGLMQSQVEVGMENASIKISTMLERYAKLNHPWRRDTGQTDQSTVGTSVHIEPMVWEAVVSAGMDYDVFLELAREGKWAWLWPAIMANRDEIKAILAEELQKALEI